MGVTIAALAEVGCGHAEPTRAEAPSRTAPELASLSRGPARTDPTWVSPARFIPDSPTSGARLVSTQKDGSSWLLVFGMRVVDRPDGSIERARELLPKGTAQVVTLPPQLGGGLLVMATTSTASPVWRTTDWLGNLEPVVELWRSAPDLVVGFDRIYVRHAAAEWQAFDPRTGDGMSLGALPHATRIGAMAFADPWRAALVTDLLGPLATFDAGNSWHRIGDLENATGVRVVEDGALAFDTPNGSSVLGEGGELMRDAPQKVTPKTSARPSDQRPGTERALAHGTWAGRAGRRPLRAAVEDGWPLALPPRAGTPSAEAVFVEAGTVHRVRLSDGAVMETRKGVTPPEASCHAVRFLAGLGFLCGLGAEDTIVYAFSEPLEIRESIRFLHPRFVSPSGNGGLVVRGPCSRSAGGRNGTDLVRMPSGASAKPRFEPSSVSRSAPSAIPELEREAPVPFEPPASLRFESSRDSQVFCFFDPRGGEREVAFGVGGAGASASRSTEKGETVRPVMLSDGRPVFLVAPRPARPGFLQIVNPGTRTADQVPLVLPSSAHWLEHARWLEGVEERRTGVLSGWVETRGVFLGFEVELDGTVRVGEHPFATARSVVSGRFAFEWQTAGGVSVETTDGGFSFRAVEAPESEVVEVPRAAVACGPIGCAAGHWLRIGWGANPAEPDFVLARGPKPFRAALQPPHEPWRFSCAPTGRASGPGATRRAVLPMSASETESMPSHATHAARSQPLGSKGAGAASDSGRAPVRRAEGKGHSESRPSPPRWTPFRGTPAPGLPQGDAAFAAETEALATVQAHLYAWGSRGADWSRAGRVLVRFDDRFDWTGVRSTAPTCSPWSSADQAADNLGIGPHAATTSWYGLLDPSGDSALLVARHGVNRSDIYGLSRSEPILVFRAAADSFLPDPMSSVRIGSSWFFLSGGGNGRSGSTHLLLHRVDGGSARILAKLPRVSTSEPPPRLVHRARSVGLGILATGPSSVGGRTVAWSVIPVHPDTGEIADPVPLLTSDLGGQAPRRCQPDDDGWLVDISPSVPPTLQIATWPDARVDSVELRMRIEPDSACVDGIAAQVDGIGGLRPPTPSEVRGGSSASDLPLAASDRSTNQRWELGCHP